MSYRLISCLCGGFLFAVLWFDLMHDVVVYPYLGQDSLVSLEAIQTMEIYYRRVVIESSPMGRLVGIVMALGILTNLTRLLKSNEPLWFRVACVGLFLWPTSWAILSIVPMAAQLAEAGGDLATQSSLAIRIFYAHIVCLGMILAFVALQFFSVAAFEQRD